VPSAIVAAVCAGVMYPSVASAYTARISVENKKLYLFVLAFASALLCWIAGFCGQLLTGYLLSKNDWQAEARQSGAQFSGAFISGIFGLLIPQVWLFFGEKKVKENRQALAVQADAHFSYSTNCCYNCGWHVSCKQVSAWILIF